MISKGSDQFKVYEDCPNCLIPDPTMVGGEENPRLLDTLKGSISEFILSEKTLKFRVYFVWKDFERDKNCSLENLSY